MTLSGRAYGGTVEEEEVVDLMTTGLLYPFEGRLEADLYGNPAR